MIGACSPLTGYVNQNNGARGHGHRARQPSSRDIPAVSPGGTGSRQSWSSAHSDFYVHRPVMVYSRCLSPRLIASGAEVAACVPFSRCALSTHSLMPPNLQSATAWGLTSFESSPKRPIGSHPDLLLRSCCTTLYAIVAHPGSGGLRVQLLSMPSPTSGSLQIPRHRRRHSAPCCLSPYAGSVPRGTLPLDHPVLLPTDHRPLASPQVGFHQLHCAWRAAVPRGTVRGMKFPGGNERRRL